jgi:DNA-binding PadR family transcriptional regulator
MRMIGNFEELVLLAVDNFKEDRENYSVKIRENLEFALKRKVVPYAVHITLRRLEKRGLLCSSFFPKRNPEKKGPSSRWYFLTTSGEAELKILRRAHRILTKRIKKTAA